MDGVGFADADSDSRDSPGDAAQSSDTYSLEPKETHQSPSSRDDAARGEPGTANPLGVDTSQDSDSVTRLARDAIEKAVRHSAVSHEGLTTLQSLLDGLGEAATDALHDTVDAVAHFFDVLSDAFRDTLDAGLAAILGGNVDASSDVQALDVSDSGESHAAVTDGGESEADETNNSGPAVVLVSSSVDDAQQLAAATNDDVLTAQFDAQHTTAESLLEQVRDLLSGQQAHSIALATNGLGDGHFELTGGTSVDLDTLQDAEMQAFWRGLADMLEPGGRIDLLACEAAEGTQGQELLTALEDLTGVNFAASVDKTGSDALGGDWVLESGHVDLATVYFDPNDLSSYTGVLGDNMPTITDTDPGNTAVGGDSAVVVDAGITVDDGDGGTDTLQGAVVRISSGFQSAEDDLSFNSGLATGFGISGSYDSDTGELVFSGTATAAEYQQVLRTVTYENSSGTPDTNPRTLLFVIGDDYDGYAYSAATGHYYQTVDSPVNWAAADAAADASTLGGLQGYLATITSTAENTTITGLVAPGQTPWVGANDATTEGEWYWVSGPETGTQFWQGDDTGAPVGGMHDNWDAGQPSDTGNSDYMSITQTGVWRDQLGTSAQRYVIEYGGLGTDTQGQLAASVVVNVAAPGANQAPVLDNSGDMNLTAISEDNTSNAGNTVASIISSAGGDRITDADGGAREGIAITAIDNTNGTWQYSADSGTNWTNIGAVADNNALLLRDTDLVRFQPASNYNGTVAGGITFRAWDRTSGSAGVYVDASTNGGTTAFSTATETASLVVGSVNDNPNVNSLLVDQIALENTAFTYQFGSSTFFDPDSGDTLTYSATLSDGSALPSWLTFTAATRTFSGTPADADVGTLNIKVTASDGNGGAASDTFALTVGNVNDAPTVANALVDQTATEDGPFSYQFASDTFNDPDLSDTLTYTATLSDDSALPDWLSFDAGTRTFSGTPTNDDVGSVSVKVTAEDGSGETVSDTFDITVENANDAPTVDSALIDQDATEGTPFSYQFVSDTFADADAGDTLTFAATLEDGGALPDWVTFDASTRTFSGTPEDADTGVITVKVTADDGNDGSVSATFTITVVGVNVAPTLTGLLVDQSVVEGNPLTYQLGEDVFTDGDTNDTLSYSATLADGSALSDWLSFDSGTRTFSGTPTNADVGGLTVKVTADDGNGGSATGTFVINVASVNNVPMLVNPLVDQGATEGSPFTYQFAADAFTDADQADVLSYTATLGNGSALPSWLSLNAATRTFSGTPTEENVGSLQIVVTASDGHGGTVSDVFIVTVAPVEDESVEVAPKAPPEQTPTDRSASTPGADTAADSGTSTPDAGGTGVDAGGFADAADSGGAEAGDATSTTDAADAAEGGDSADAGEVADAGDANSTADAADGGGEASSSTASADGAARSDAGGAAGSNRSSVGESTSNVQYHKRDDDAGYEAGQWTSQINSVAYNEDLLSDESQPEEFREAWGTILSAYTSSSEEVGTYLQTAFRAVTESAVVYQAAEQSLSMMSRELALATEVGIDIDSDALMTSVGDARDEVKAASKQLEDVILAAAEVGKDAELDKVLEDVISAALERLMMANEALFVETQVLAAASTVLQSARTEGEKAVDQMKMASAVSKAKLDAHEVVVEMRKAWDRVAQDVFSAFVERMAAEKTDNAEGPKPG